MACSIFLCNAAGKSKFGSGTGKRDAKGIYRKYKLIKAYIFFAKGMTQKNAIEKSHKTCDKTCNGQNSCSADESALSGHNRLLYI